MKKYNIKRDIYRKALRDEIIVEIMILRSFNIDKVLRGLRTLKDLTPETLMLKLSEKV